MEKMCAGCNAIFEAAVGIPRTGNDGPYCSSSCREKVRRVIDKHRRVLNTWNQGFPRG